MFMTSFGGRNVGKYLLMRFFSKELKALSTVTNDNSSEKETTIDYLSEKETTIDDSVFLRKRVPFSMDEYKIKRKLKPSQPENPHILKVAMLGEPNVGKSTLTNSLMKWKVCSVSKKVHTTRKKTAAIYTEDNKQIIYLDTPGFVTPEHSIKHHLEVSLVADPERSVQEADLIAVIVDCACKWTNNRINPEILDLLDKFKEKQSILILNKVDIQSRKHRLLKITRNLTCGIIGGQVCFKKEDRKEMIKNPQKSLEDIFAKTEKILFNTDHTSEEEKKDVQVLKHFEGAIGWAGFLRVFMVSALNGTGIDDIRKFLLDSCKPGDWLYHATNVIDLNPHDIALSIVREKLLDELPQEVPYNLNISIRHWEVDESGCIRIHIDIKCLRLRYRRLIIGSSGGRISKCVEECQRALQDTFRSEVYLKLFVY